MDRFEEVKRRVKDANDLVAVIESYLPLRASGRNMVALCPFHQEKTPSFTVYPESQHFKCYGCGKAGDVITFVMEREGLGFREAFEALAQRAGVSLDGVFERGAAKSGPRVDPHGVLAEVQRLCAELLHRPEGERARSYLAGRGLEAAIEPFGLGVHPAAPGALRGFAARRKLPLDVLEQAGLLRSDGYEPFRGRLMFPIEDERGRIVGFGGRLLEEGRAKYINSTESPFFAKRRVLYGLRRAKQAGERRIVVVEGYTDVIACHLAGFTGAVATLGTAFTPDHGRVLLRYASDGVVLLFDGDRAGCAAAERAYGELARSDIVAKIALLPDGMDPADLLAPRPGRSAEDLQRAREAFEAVLHGAEDALAVWFRLKRSRLDMTQEVVVSQVVDECGQVLAGVEDATRRTVLLARMARHLGLDERAIRQRLTRRRGIRQTEPSSRRPVAAPVPARDPLQLADLEMLACVLAQPALAGAVADEPPGHPRTHRLLQLACEAEGEGGRNPQELLRYLFTRCAGDGELQELLAQSADLVPSLRAPAEALETLRAHRRAWLARRQAQQIRYELQQARAAGDDARADELTRLYLTQLRDHRSA